MKIKLNYQIRVLLTLIFVNMSILVFAQGSSSDITTRELSVELFKGIELGGAYEVTLEKGTSCIVKITTQEKIQEKINAKVENGVLKIETESKIFKNTQNVKVHIVFVDLHSLKIAGATEVKGISILTSPDLFIESSGASDISLDINSNKLVVEVSGAGNVKLTGEAKNLSAEVSGAGELKAKQLKAEKADVNVSGAGNAYLNVTGTLDCIISGAGNVNYIGDPEIKNITKSGSGQISTNKSNDKGVVVVDIKDDDEYVNVRVGGLGIEVIENDDTTKISFGRHNIVIDDNGNVKYNKSAKRTFNGHWAGVDLGVNGFITKNWDMNIPPEYSFLELKQEKSWTVSINPFEQNFNIARNHFGLITGIGFQWINYRFDNNVILSGDSSTIFGYKDDSRNYTKSKLNICYANIPILLEYQTNRHMKANSFHITAGMIFGLRIGSHSKIVYDDGNKQKFKNRDDFHLNPFKLDANVRIGWGWINLFGTYSINTLFRKERGPELYPFTAGITLVGW